MSKKPTLLIDADIILCQSCFAAQETIEWGDGERDVFGSELEAKALALEAIGKLVDELNGNPLLCFSDHTNFRYDVLPTYKANRKDKPKPLHWAEVREFLGSQMPYRFRKGLEADDMMGILATHPTMVPGEKIICSKDKDLRQIPGLLCQDGRKVEEISEEGGDWWHLYQTLIGDSCDGYTGCPKIGPVKAKRALAENGASWDTVRAQYALRDLSEDDALTQARVARILRTSDYDFKADKPILWSPRVAPV